VPVFGGARSGNNAASAVIHATAPVAGTCIAERGLMPPGSNRTPIVATVARFSALVAQFCSALRLLGRRTHARRAVAYSYKFVLVLRARYFMLECSCQIVLQTANSIVLELVSLQYSNYVHVRAEEALKSDIVTSNPTRSQISVPIGSNLRRICRSEEHSTNTKDCPDPESKSDGQVRIVLWCINQFFIQVLIFWAY
jgi:hypothetical protein